LNQNAFTLITRRAHGKHGFIKITTAKPTAADFRNQKCAADVNNSIL
jgi:hypothetical protein